MPARHENTDGLVWKIALGIVFAAAILAGLRAIHQQIAIRQFNEQMATISAQAQAQSRKFQAEAARQHDLRREDERLRRQADLQARQLRPDERCISKQLFRRVENGWVQVTDASVALKCGR